MRETTEPRTLLDVFGTAADGTSEMLASDREWGIDLISNFADFMNTQASLLQGRQVWMSDIKAWRVYRMNSAAFWPIFVIRCVEHWRLHTAAGGMWRGKYVTHSLRDESAKRPEIREYAVLRRSIYCRLTVKCCGWWFVDNHTSSIRARSCPWKKNEDVVQP